MRRTLLVLALVTVAFVTVASVLSCATGIPEGPRPEAPAVMVHP